MEKGLKMGADQRWVFERRVSPFGKYCVVAPPLPLAPLFFCRRVIYLFFFFFWILWYQFKSLYKCPRIQYKVFLFEEMYFLWLGDWRTYMIIFFLQVFIYLTLVFFCFKYLCTVFLISLYRNSTVWIKLAGFQTHLTKWTRTGGGTSAEMLAGSAHRGVGETSTLCLFRSQRNNSYGNRQSGSSGRFGPLIIIIKKHLSQTLRLHWLPTRCHNHNPSTRRNPNFLNQVTSIYNSKHGKYFWKRERCF